MTGTTSMTVLVKKHVQLLLVSTYMSEFIVRRMHVLYFFVELANDVETFHELIRFIIATQGNNSFIN